MEEVLRKTRMVRVVQEQFRGEDEVQSPIGSSGVEDTRTSGVGNQSLVKID